MNEKKNAASLDNTLAEDQYKRNLRKVEIVPSIRRYITGPVWKDSG